MFKTPHIGYFILILYGMYITTVAVFQPDYVFPTALKPVVERLAYQTRVIIFVLAWLAHILEACLVLHWSRKVGDSWAESLLWFVQTSLVGYPSTSIKLQHYRQVSKRQA